MTYNPTAAWDRDELARLRTENEALTQELATVRDTLRHRSNALNATGTHNDQLRAQLARVQKLPNEWDGIAEELRQWTANVAANSRVARAYTQAAKSLRAILADKEPTP